MKKMFMPAVAGAVDAKFDDNGKPIPQRFGYSLAYYMVSTYLRSEYPSQKEKNGIAWSKIGKKEWARLTHTDADTMVGGFLR